MLLRIQKYDFTVKYVPGKDIPIADGLSRLPIHGDEIPDIDMTIHDIIGVSELRLQKIKDETKCDLTRFNKIAIQGTPQMAIDEEAISLSRVYSYDSKCTLRYSMCNPP